MTDIPGMLPTGAVLSALPLSSSPTLAIDSTKSIKVREQENENDTQTLPPPKNLHYF